MPSRIDRIRYGIVDWLLLAAGCVLLYQGYVGGHASNLPKSALFLSAGIVLILASSLDRLELLSGVGIQIRTRQLNAKIRDLEELLLKTRRLAELSSQEIIWHNSMIGRHDAAPSTVAQYKVAREVYRLLQDLGTDEKTIDDIVRPCKKILLNDLAKHILTPLRECIAINQTYADGVIKNLAPDDVRSRDADSLSRQRARYSEYAVKYINPACSDEPDQYPDVISVALEAFPESIIPSDHPEHQRHVDLRAKARSLFEELNGDMTLFRDSLCAKKIIKWREVIGY